MSYNIQIDEAQRARMVAALELLDAKEPVDGSVSVEAFGVAELRAMLMRLPEDEAQHPKVTHGLCW